MTEIKAARTGLEDVEEALKDVIDPEVTVYLGCPAMA
jgi:metal-sulfur cluster biosynthetic enzyme